VADEFERLQNITSPNRVRITPAEKQVNTQLELKAFAEKEATIGSAEILAINDVRNKLNAKIDKGQAERKFKSDPSNEEQSASRFPLHICGVKPTVSEESPFNEQVCGAEAKYTLHSCEAMR
jgi:hypothetical protein